MTSTEVTEATKGSVPALVHQPALEIEAEDVALPRMYIGQYMSDHVKDKSSDVAAGDIFSAVGSDDPDPQVLFDGDGEGVLIHVLGLRKGKSLSVDGELETWSYDDPDAPAEAWTTYNYFVFLPEVDQDVPYKWLLTRTGKPAAQQINTVLKRAEGRGPSWSVAFRVTTAQRKNRKGEYFVPRVRQVDAEEDHVAQAEKLAQMIAGVSAEAQATGDEPAI